MSASRDGAKVCICSALPTVVFPFCFSFSHPESNSASFCFIGPRYFTDLCTQHVSRASGVSWGPSREARSPIVTTGQPCSCLLCVRQAAPLDLKLYISVALSGRSTVPFWPISHLSVDPELKVQLLHCVCFGSVSRCKDFGCHYVMHKCCLSRCLLTVK